MIMRQEELLQRIQENGIDSKSDGYPLLYLACYYGYVDVVKLLIQMGVDVDAVYDVNGSTPAHACAIMGNHECLSLLVDGGVNTNARDDYGKTAIMYTDDNLCIRLLIGNGCRESNENLELILKLDISDYTKYLIRNVMV